MSNSKENLCDLRNQALAVVGLGHVGLPTAAAFCEMGWRVIGADNDAAKIAAMQSGCPPFHEPGLEDLLQRQLRSGRFHLTTSVDEAIRAASFIFICVGTPQAADGSADLRLVEALARTIASNLNGYKLIVEKSTVPAITGHWIRKTMERELAARALRSSNGNANGKAHHDMPEFEIASNPEFLQEGKAIENLFCPDRIVCGVASERSRDILQALYAPLNRPILFTDVNTAELIKHTANAFLAMKISYINFIADVCEAVGADVRQVATGIGLDRRIGRGFLDAGIGFGGYCLPKDLRALTHLAEDHSVKASLLREVEAVNANRLDVLVQKIQKALWLLPGKTLAILGLSFKAGTDDVRDSPSLKVVDELARRGATLRLFDPRAMDNAAAIVPAQPGTITYCHDAYDAAENADALVVLTDWEEFRSLDFERMRELLKVPLLVDARNLFDVEIARAHGFEYICMGGNPERRSRRPDTPSNPIDSVRDMKNEALAAAGIAANRAA
jgi:UDPglucose 6-dehydrogenase